MDHLVVPIAKADLRPRRGGRNTGPPKVFVAYRMNAPESARFRRTLGTLLTRYVPAVITDGNVPEGSRWADEIRSRIRSARLFVADVSGPSREVMLEFGVASNRPFVPVVATRAELHTLPDWLTVFQMGTYAGEGMAEVAFSLASQLRGETRVVHRRPTVIPNRVAIVARQADSWADPCLSAFADRAREFSLEVKIYRPEELHSYEDLADILRSWLIVASLSGAQTDHAAHFLFGDVVGRPTTGGRGGLHRSAIAVLENPADPGAFLADSARRVGRQRLGWCSPADLQARGVPHLRRFKQWVVSGS